MIVMGIDYGFRRIGVAISDPGGTMAVPLETIAVKVEGAHMERIRKLAQDYRVEQVVVGLPYNMDGTVSEMGRTIMEWVPRLQEYLERPVALFDERLTSFEAHDMLASMGVKGKKHAAMVDQIAACLILKEYLASRAL